MKLLISKISSYLTISLLVLCIAMGGIIYSGYAKITVLNSQVTTAQTRLQEANSTIKTLREENTALNIQLSELMTADSNTREKFDSIEDEWDELVRRVGKKEPVKESSNETNQIVDRPVDLSGHFRLLLESACEANNCVRNHP